LHRFREILLRAAEIFLNVSGNRGWRCQTGKDINKSKHFGFECLVLQGPLHDFADPEFFPEKRRGFTLHEFIQQQSGLLNPLFKVDVHFISLLFPYSHSQTLNGLPIGVVLKDEHPTSNNDVAPFRNLISFIFKNPMSNFESLFLFIFSRFDTRSEILALVFAFHSRFDVGPAVLAHCRGRRSTCLPMPANKEG